VISRRSQVLAACVLGLALVAPLKVPATSAAQPSPSAATSTVPLPTLSEPPAGLRGHPLWDSWHELATFGYTQHEYFVSGTATAADGTTAPYTTRILVFRPASQKDFNGAVLLDWVNVTAQFENAVDSLEAHEMLLREGWAFVDVSAQSAGLCCIPLTPKLWDPVRYAAINHPGDAYSADMFSQVAKAVRTHAGLDPMRGLEVRRVIAAGQSQSADKLYDYVVHNQASADVIDGFLIHGNGTVKKTFPAALPVPVLNLLSDREGEPAAPTDDPNYRLWEVAATAHSDYFIGYQSVFGHGPRVLADLPAVSRAGYQKIIDAAGNYGQIPDPLLAACTVAGASMPMHYATSAALHQLDRWVRTGQRPAVTPRFTFAADGTLAKDAFGNTLGGIRMPPVEVPVARYESTLCELGGLTIPFTDLKIRALYPTFADYQQKMRLATDRAVRSGWLLRPDAVDQMRRVCSVQSRYPVGDRGTCAPYTPPRFAGSGKAHHHH
jgi:hypothetical protein